MITFNVSAVNWIWVIWAGTVCASVRMFCVRTGGCVGWWNNRTPFYSRHVFNVSSYNDHGVIKCLRHLLNTSLNIQHSVLFNIFWVSFSEWVCVCVCLRAWVLQIIMKRAKHLCFWDFRMPEIIDDDDDVNNGSDIYILKWNKNEHLLKIICLFCALAGTVCVRVCISRCFIGVESTSHSTQNCTKIHTFQFI